VYNKPEVAKVLLANGAQVNARRNKDWGRTALHYAAMKGHEALAQGLLVAGADINAADRWRNTALHLAAFEGHEALAQRLLGAGADITAANKDGSTPLHDTARCNKPEVAKVLLANGAQVNAHNNFGKTALDVATNDEVKASLLQHGARHLLFYAAE
jgi:ankyrin repeat protein